MSHGTSCAPRAARAKALALLLSLALALSTLAASFTVDALHDHDCHGDDCVACHVVGMATALLAAHAAPAGNAASLVVCAALCVLACAAWRLSRAAETPVSRCDLLLI